MDTSGLDEHIANAGQNPVALVDTQLNPFALPPLKKPRHSVTTKNRPPILASSGPSQLKPAGPEPSAQMVPSGKHVEPAVRFSDNVQVYREGYRNPSAKANVGPASARITGSLAGYKRLRPQSDDETSDLEGELKVMDTPTSSQQELDTSHAMSDSDVEVVDGPSTKFQSLSIKCSGSLSSSPIPIQRTKTNSVARASRASQKPGSTRPVQPPKLINCGSENVPLQSKAIPRAVLNENCSTFYGEMGIKDRRRDLRDEMLRLISDTEEARLEVSKEVSMTMIHVYKISI
jgi:hypothetical protein